METDRTAGLHVYADEIDLIGGLEAAAGMIRGSREGRGMLHHHEDVDSADCFDAGCEVVGPESAQTTPMIKREILVELARQLGLTVHRSDPSLRIEGYYLNVELMELAAKAMGGLIGDHDTKGAQPYTVVTIPEG